MFKFCIMGLNLAIKVNFGTKGDLPLDLLRIPNHNLPKLFYIKDEIYRSLTRMGV